MSVAENKAIVRRYMDEVWNEGNLGVVDELFATNYVLHDPMPGLANNREGLKQRVIMMHTAFPDYHLTVEDLIAEGDKVAYRWMVRGTHQHELMGIAPTHKQVTVTGATISHIGVGKFVADWTEFDALGLMQQLDVIPPLGPAGK